MLLGHISQINQDVRNPDARVIDAGIVRRFSHRIGEVGKAREELLRGWVVEIDCPLLTIRWAKGSPICSTVSRIRASHFRAHAAM